MTTRRPRSRGFTLIELMLSSLLMAVALGLLANAWVSFARPAINAVARCRVAQEANLAAEAFADDFGTLAVSPNDPLDGRYGNIQPGVDGTSFSLNFDTGRGMITNVIYSWDEVNSNLVRAGSGQTRVVANLLTGFQAVAATQSTSQGVISGVRIQLTFTHAANDCINGNYCNKYTRQYTLFLPDP